MRTVALIHHRVRDFDAWRKVYDEFRGAQHEGGVHFQQAMRSQDDPSMVVVEHAFDSREAAEAFMAKPELRAAMEGAGVDPSTLQVEYLDEVEFGDV